MFVVSIAPKNPSLKYIAKRYSSHTVFPLLSTFVRGWVDAQVKKLLAVKSKARKLVR
jgi:hypothetical protein